MHTYTELTSICDRLWLRKRNSLKFCKIINMNDKNEEHLWQKVARKLKLRQSETPGPKQNAWPTSASVS